MTKFIHVLFFHRLTSAERNYDVGNRELLAIRLALGEWRHWLEGASVPFIVWTDHRNLEYIRSAKRLNARKLAGRYSLVGSSFPSPTDPAQRMVSLMLSHVSSARLKGLPPRRVSYHTIVWSGLPSGESSRL